ncbi:MAG TPA: hypothetical protein V6D35_22245 [Candidatus Sericytochromatia bacterium]
MLNFVNEGVGRLIPKRFSDNLPYLPSHPADNPWADTTEIETVKLEVKEIFNSVSGIQA